MLVSLKEILKLAEAKKCAVGAFNTPNLASLRAVIGAAETLREPIIIMHAQVHEEMGLCKMEEIAPIMLFMADRAAVPVCVHLDHGTDLDYIKKGLDLGFTSVMYDGSESAEALNYANTSLAVELARRYGASVEAELARWARGNRARKRRERIYRPGKGRKFARETALTHWRALLAPRMAYM